MSNTSPLDDNATEYSWEENLLYDDYDQETRVSMDKEDRLVDEEPMKKRKASYPVFIPVSIKLANRATAVK
jgi:protein associated with RNAse G/E